MKTLPLFDRFSIPKPCPMRWEEMVGDDRSRFCGVCQKTVANLGSLTVDEVRALAAKGRVCVRTRQSAAIARTAAAVGAGVVFALSAACAVETAADPTLGPEEPSVGEQAPVTSAPATEATEAGVKGEMMMMGDMAL